MELTGDSMELKPINTRKLRRRGNEPTDSRLALLHLSRLCFSFVIYLYQSLEVFVSDADPARRFRIFLGAALQKTITWTLLNRGYRPGGQRLAIFPLPLKNLMEGVL
jgi:hypothetical protein